MFPWALSWLTTLQVNSCHFKFPISRYYFDAYIGVYELTVKGNEGTQTGRIVALALGWN